MGDDKQTSKSEKNGLGVHFSIMTGILFVMTLVSMYWTSFEPDIPSWLHPVIILAIISAGVVYATIYLVRRRTNPDDRLTKTSWNIMAVVMISVSCCGIAALLISWQKRFAPQLTLVSLVSLPTRSIHSLRTYLSGAVNPETSHTTWMQRVFGQAYGKNRAIKQPANVWTRVVGRPQPPVRPRPSVVTPAVVTPAVVTPAVVTPAATQGLTRFPLQSLDSMNSTPNSNSIMPPRAALPTTIPPPVVTPVVTPAVGTPAAAPGLTRFPLQSLDSMNSSMPPRAALPTTIPPPVVTPVVTPAVGTPAAAPGLTRFPLQSLDSMNSLPNSNSNSSMPPRAALPTTTSQPIVTHRFPLQSMDSIAQTQTPMVDKLPSNADFSLGAWGHIPPAPKPSWTRSNNDVPLRAWGKHKLPPIDPRFLKPSLANHRSPENDAMFVSPELSEFLR
jgi:hypothetical protein